MHINPLDTLWQPPEKRRGRLKRWGAMTSSACAVHHSIDSAEGSTSAGFATSACTAIACPPATLISETASSALAALLAQFITRAKPCQAPRYGASKSSKGASDEWRYLLASKKRDSTSLSLRRWWFATWPIERSVAPPRLGAPSAPPSGSTNGISASRTGASHGEPCPKRGASGGASRLVDAVPVRAGRQLRTLPEV